MFLCIHSNGRHLLPSHSTIRCRPSLPSRRFPKSSDPNILDAVKAINTANLLLPLFLQPVLSQTREGRRLPFPFQSTGPRRLRRPFPYSFHFLSLIGLLIATPSTLPFHLHLPIIQLSSSISSDEPPLPLSPATSSSTKAPLSANSVLPPELLPPISPVGSHSSVCGVVTSSSPPCLRPTSSSSTSPCFRTVVFALLLRRPPSPLSIPISLHTCANCFPDLKMEFRLKM